MEGTLDATPVPEVLQSFTSGGKSGILHLSRGSSTKRIYFRNGAIVFASSDDAEERLGERLVRAGAIKRSDLELACRVVASSRLRLGATLVEMGYLSTEELDRRLKEQITSIVYSLFPWESGHFRAEIRDRPVPADLERCDLPTASLLMEGVRRIEDFSTIRRGLGGFDGPLSHALDPTKLQGDVELTPEEGFVLSRVDGSTSPGEIAKLSPLGEEQTLRCVYALLAAGILEVRVAAKPVPPGEREPSSEALRFLEEMREKQRASAGSTFYQILEVEPSASPGEIKAAYLRLTKRLHPDHRAGLKLDDADGVLDDLYLRVKEAHEILTSETERRRYDLALSQKAERQARAQETAAANPAPKGRQGPSPVPVPDPDSKRTFTAQQTARIHFGNGERYFGDGRYHEAIEELRAAVRLDPSRAQYHRALGRALSKNPKWRKQAEDAFSKALELNRFDAESYVGLGELYHEGGLETRARKMFEEALAVDPDNVHALERLASERTEGTFGRLREMMKRSRGQ